MNDEDLHWLSVYISNIKTELKYIDLYDYNSDEYAECIDTIKFFTNRIDRIVNGD